jgi:ABC-2 type transport system ATP-binding protein
VGAGSVLPVVRARGLSYRYDSGRDALDGVGLDAFAGETVVVVGPNGSGKSTLLRLIAGHLAPTGGRVDVRGMRAHTLAPRSVRHVGFCSDEAVHLEALTGRENAIFWARAMGLTRTEAPLAIEPLFHAFTLDAAADLPVADYSFGMRRKLLLVEALAHRPELVVLDEPTIGLDSDAVGQLALLLAVHARSGGTTVAATNDLRFAVERASRLVFLHQGRKVADDSPESLLSTVGEADRIEVELEGSTDRELVLPSAAKIVVREPGRLLVESERGIEVLPSLCEALLRAGARPHRIEVRRSGLPEVFRRLTGAELPPTGPSHPDSTVGASGAPNGSPAGGRSKDVGVPARTVRTASPTDRWGGGKET